MNPGVWKKFIKTKERFRVYAEEISSSLPFLKDIQQEFADSRSKVSYKIQTPVVYNTALDDITVNDKIKLILVADNPGRREQAAENRRYLVGPSGKIADRFFKNNPSLGIEFYKNVIILNKTPIHSPRTIELRELCRTEKAGETLSQALMDSQKFMADLLLEFYDLFTCPVWIIGYSEMKRKGLFEVYTERLKEISGKNIEFYKQLNFFRHFSMNQFTIDLKQKSLNGETVEKTLKKIGKAYRERILG